MFHGQEIGPYEELHWRHMESEAESIPTVTRVWVRSKLAESATGVVWTVVGIDEGPGAAVGKTNISGYFLRRGSESRRISTGEAARCYTLASS